MICKRCGELMICTIGGDEDYYECPACGELEVVPHDDDFCPYCGESDCDCWEWEGADGER
jgi:hypothetical protein